MKKVAIVYHYLAHYRLPIFREMMQSNYIEYSFFSGISTEIPIKTIDPRFRGLPEKEGGLRWYHLENRWLFRKKFLWQSGLLQIALQSDFDSFVFLGTPYHLSTWLAALIARIRGKKVYYWMHGVHKDKLRFGDYIKLFVFYKIAHGFFLYGNRSAQILKKYKVKSDDNIHVVYNSLDYKKMFNHRSLVSSNAILNYRNKYFKNSIIPIIVFIGRLNETKCINLLLEAQKKLRIKYNKDVFNILIVGDGEERFNLEKLTQSYNLQNNVIFLGVIYDELSNSELIKNADLCVTPGEVGLTAIHSFSYGTPVISHDNLDIQMPEVEAIKRGLNGELYKYNNVDDLARVIYNWLIHNPIKNQSIANECFKLVDSCFNPYYQIKVFDSVLNNNERI